MRKEPRRADVVMSKGSAWTYQLKGKPGDQWPNGSTESIFYDSTGGVLTTLEGGISGGNLLYEIEPVDVNDIPHGAGYEMFVTPDATGLPQMVQYGIVTRAQVRFPDAPPVDISETALLFGDTFDRVITGPKWVVKNGRPAIADGSIGAKQQLFDLAEKCALLFYAPLNSDDLTINVTFDAVGAGTATMVFCSNYQMSSYLGVQILDAGTDKVHIVKGTGPTTMTSVANVTSTTVDTDNFLIKYNSQTDTVSVFKNDSSTALLSKVGISGVPHGEGFRYLAMNFATTALLSTGPRINEWSAKDGL